MDNIRRVMDMIWHLTHVPVRLIGEGNGEYSGSGADQEDDPVLRDSTLLDGIRESGGEKPAALYVEEDIFVFGTVGLGEAGAIIAGPVCIEAVGSARIVQFFQRHGVQGRDSLPHCTIEYMCTILALLCQCLTDSRISGQDILTAEPIDRSRGIYQYRTYMLDKTEEDEASRLDYAVEQRQMRYITQGDPEAILQSGDMEAVSRIGKFAKSTLKQYEYMACSAITLATRAAIEGGLDPRQAYMVSDVAKQNLELCKSVGEMVALQREVRVNFARMVRDERNKSAKISYVEHCKLYIAGHLNTPFTLDDIAGEIGMNKYYLSRRFSEVVGMGIQQYTRTQRIKAAANMLKYSDESISHISSYLCFPSQSHFGKVFREHTGVTPQRYRNREKADGFDQQG